MKKTLWTVTALLIPILTSWGAASVTVKQSGGGDFTSIQAAINSGASTITIMDSAHYVENIEIGDPDLPGLNSAVTLTSNQSGTNRPVITPSANKLYVTARRVNQQAGFGLFAGNSVISNLIIEAQPDFAVGAMLILANNVLIENCVFRIAAGTFATASATTSPLLCFAQQGGGANDPTPGGVNSDACLVRNCEFMGIAADADPVEPVADVAFPGGINLGYLGQKSNGTGTGQASGYMRSDYVSDGRDVSCTFEGCYFHHSRDFGLFPSRFVNGTGSVNLFVKKCRFDANGKFHVRGRGANIYVEDSVFTRANQIRNGDTENSAVAIQTQDGNSPSGSVSNCVFLNCGSANAQRAYYGGVNNNNGDMLSVDRCTFVDCVSGVGAGTEDNFPATLAVSDSIFHQIGDNVPLAIDAAGIALTNGHPDLVGGLYLAWTNGLTNFAASKWSAVFNRFRNNGSQIIIDNCLVGTIDTEDMRTWADALAADVLDPTTSVTGCRLLAGLDTAFTGAETVIRDTPVFANTDPDAPNAFELASGSPGQGLGASLGPVLKPKLSFNKSGNQFTISWTQPLWMKGVLKSTPSLSNPVVWTPVENVSNNSVSINIGAGNQFFAILKQ